MGFKNPEDQAAYQRRYRRDGGGKATLQRYDSSPKGKINRAKANRTLYHRYLLLTYRARRKNLGEFVTFESYTEIVKDKPCYLCGKDLSDAAGVGLDRLDNRLGYISTNVAPCCKRCNMRKGYLEAAGFAYPRTVELLKELLCTS